MIGKMEKEQMAFLFFKLPIFSSITDADFPYPLGPMLIIPLFLLCKLKGRNDSPFTHMYFTGGLFCVPAKV